VHLLIALEFNQLMLSLLFIQRCNVLDEGRCILVAEVVSCTGARLRVLSPNWFEVRRPESFVLIFGHDDVPTFKDLFCGSICHLFAQSVLMDLIGRSGGACGALGSGLAELVESFFDSSALAEALVLVHGSIEVLLKLFELQLRLGFGTCAEI